MENEIPNVINKDIEEGKIIDKEIESTEPLLSNNKPETIIPTENSITPTVTTYDQLNTTNDDGRINDEVTLNIKNQMTENLITEGKPKVEFSLIKFIWQTINDFTWQTWTKIGVVTIILAVGGILILTLILIYIKLTIKLF